MRRKPLYLLLGFLLVNFIYLYGPHQWVLMYAFFSLLMPLFQSKAHMKLYALGMCLALFAIVVFNQTHTSSEAINSVLSSPEAHEVVLVGELDIRQQLKLEEAWLKTKNEGKFLVRFDKENPPNWEAGRSYEVRGKIRQADFERNDNTFDEGLWLKSMGAQGTIYATHIEAKPENNIITALRSKIGQKLLEGIMQNTAFLEGPVAAGMILGEDEWIDDNILEAYKKSGVLHILSISGAHFGVFLLWLNKGLQKISQSHRLKKNIAYGILLLYLWLIGFPTTALRALVMYYIYEIFKMNGAQSDNLNALSLTVIGMLLINPFYLSQIGFELAVFAMFGLTIIYPLIARWLELDVKKYNPIISPREWLIKYIKALMAYIVLNLSIALCMAPILITKMNQYSWWSLLYNFPAALLSAVALPLCFLQSLLLMYRPLQQIVGIMSGAVLWLMNLMIETVQYLPQPAIQGSLGNIACLFIMLMLFGIIGAKEYAFIYHHCFNIHKKYRWCLFILFVVIILCILNKPYLLKYPTNMMEIQFYDVGQGDGYSIHTKNEKTILVDSGLKKMPTTMANLLAKKGLTHIDYFILSHPHADHIGGALDVLEHVKVERLLYYEGHYNESETQALSDIKEMAIKKGVLLVSVQKGDAFVIDPSTKVEILAPVFGKDTSSANDESIVFQLSYKDISFVGTGDISQTEDYGIMSEVKNEHIILKVPHHGSKTSSSDELLNEDAIDLAICQVGRRNLYGHPTKEALNRYEAHQIPLLRNDQLGAVTVITDGHGIQIRTAYNNSRGLWR